jgi:hypothetical protein
MILLFQVLHPSSAVWQIQATTKRALVLQLKSARQTHIALAA